MQERTSTRWIGLVPLLALSCQGASAAPSPSDQRFRAVTKWRGTFDVEVKVNGSWKGRAGVDCSWSDYAGTANVQESYHETFTFDKINPSDSATSWSGQGIATASHKIALHAENTNTPCPGTEAYYSHEASDETRTGSASGFKVEDGGQLLIDFETGRYELDLYAASQPERGTWKRHTTRTGVGYDSIDDSIDLGLTGVGCGAFMLGSPLPPATAAGTTYLIALDGDPTGMIAASTAGPPGMPLPATGMILSGSRTWNMSIAPTFQIANGPQPTHGGTVRVTWKIEPDVEDLQVLVDVDDYDAWLPQGTTDENVAGNEVGINARLVDADGKPSAEKAHAFRFELVDVSHQPGVAMNFPHDPRPTPDLKFDSVRNPPQMTVTDRQAVRADGNLTEARAVLSSYDWGAFGRIRVVAVMPGGREIVGHLLTDRSETLIKIPRREEASKIGNYWKVMTGVNGSDVDDDESEPAGDGHPGDGFSLYEEYRGFYENGVHMFGDPHGKDLFIRDRIGGASKRAIAHFAATTRLIVHHELTAAEFRAQDRVMNDNHDGETPRQGDQTGLVMVNVPPRGYASSEGGPGVPKLVARIEVPTSLATNNFRTLVRDGQSFVGDHYVATVAHELLHACNVFHHGEGDDDKLRWIIGPAVDGKQQVTERGQPITVLTEGGAPAMFPANSDFPVYVGKPHAQHSGFENCLMRYDNSIAYISDHDASVRYSTEKEVIGMSLCDDDRGTGVNDPGHFPQSRFHEAAKGACRKQLCINDRFHE